MGRAGMVMNAITTVGAPGLAPVRGTARIEVLDMLRGIALLGILFINIPYMAAPVAQFSADVRAIGWTLPARIAWRVRSEGRRVGTEWVGQCRSRWSPYHEKKKKNNM